MSEPLPILISVVVAIIGSVGGVAALLKVSSDNSKTIADGASTVVTMMGEQLEEHNKRLEALEEYISHLHLWSDRLVDVLDRAVQALPEPHAEPLKEEAAKVRATRPKRKTV